MGQAVITLKVGKAWADKYGADNVRILRVGDDGTKEVLPTTFDSYDGNQAIFEGISENGLSYFGLAAVKSTGGGGVPLSAIIGGVAAAVVIVGAVAVILLLRTRHSSAEA
jgi:hypothetical protein